MLYVNDPVVLYTTVRKINNDVVTYSNDLLITNLSKKTVRIDEILIKFLGDNSTGIVRLYYLMPDLSFNFVLFKEIPIAITMSTSNVVMRREEKLVNQNIFLKPNQQIGVTFSSSGAVNLTTQENVFNIFLRGFEISNN